MNSPAKGTKQNKTEPEIHKFGHIDRVRPECRLYAYFTKDNYSNTVTIND